jgi:hypothetical protein
MPQLMNAAQIQRYPSIFGLIAKPNPLDLAKHNAVTAIAHYVTMGNLNQPGCGKADGYF